MNLITFQHVLSYIDICTKKLEDRFAEIVSEDVELEYKTNDEESINVRGRDAVIDQFVKSIFHSTKIPANKRNILPTGEKITLNVKVIEDKEEEEKVYRYVFEETTIFEFKKDAPHQISRIVTTVKHTQMEIQ